MLDEAVKRILTLSDAEQRTVARLRAEGLTARDIATKSGLPFAPVKQWLLDHPPTPPKVTKPKAKRETPDYGGFDGGLFQCYAWDLETTHLKADMGTLLVAAFLDLHTGEIHARNIIDCGGNEKALVEWTLERMEEADVLIGHHSSVFDRNFMSGVAARLGLRQPPKRIHLDTVQIARHGLKGALQSASMENLVDYFGIAIPKDKPSKHEWRGANLLTEEDVDRITVRCVEDVKVQALLWTKLRRYFHEWKGSR